MYVDNLKATVSETFTCKLQNANTSQMPDSRVPIFVLHHFESQNVCETRPLLKVMQLCKIYVTILTYISSRWVVQFHLTYVFDRISNNNLSQIIVTDSVANVRDLKLNETLIDSKYLHEFDKTLTQN